MQLPNVMGISIGKCAEIKNEKKSEYLEKAYIVSRAGNHEEAAEYAMEGMKIAKRNGDSELTDALITIHLLAL